ncbi:MAG: FAD-binding oxidoreductase [Alphaproteobacteria bacterium]|nr:MAG: FAD-binding oxidoreductase [Alphaproteobacteria bacterium]
MTLNPCDEAFVERLRTALPPGRVHPPEPRYLEEPRGLWRGRAGAVATPANVQEVATIIRLAGEARVGVVPYGGGTGLVGGQVMAEGPLPLVLSLERMAAVRAVHASENVLVAEAGAVLAEVQAAAEAQGRLFPLSLASQGSARIGGLLSTNAGGVNVLRYGTARELCLGLEAVLPDGSVWHGLRRLRKDNTGYDLRDLLIGAEGTLGVITAASLRLFPRPAATGTALVVVEGPAAALELLALAQEIAGPALTAFELISGQGLRFEVETGFALRQPFDPIPDWLVLIDLGCARGQDPQGLLEAIFTEGHAKGLVADGVIAASEAQRGHLWALRESIPLANRKIGALASHDISLPLSAIPAFLDEAGAQLTALGPWRINAFGHLGDGNLHYNVFPPAGRRREEFAGAKAQITRLVHDLVARMEGSISAEHGIGRLKRAELERYADPAGLKAMRAIKAALDPLGIMNPGAVLRG